VANVYVEPRPKALDEHAPITHYVLEYKNDERVTWDDYKTQADAIADAKRLGHQPLVARVRNTDKGNPDHWRHA
jgi:hypothetical protein